MKKIVKFTPNILTISRIIMAVMFVSNIVLYFTFRKDNFISTIVLFITICLSDFLDGRIARKTGSTSVIGAKLDVFADLFFIVLSSTVLVILKVIPLWYIVFVFFKFFEFIITSDILKRKNNSTGKTFVFDRIGRIVSASFFIVPCLAYIFKVMIQGASAYLIDTLLYLLLAGGICSSYSRISRCLKLTSKNSLNGGDINESA